MAIMFLIAAEISVVISVTYFIKVAWYVFSGFFARKNEEKHSVCREKVAINERSLKHYLLLSFVFIFMSMSCRYFDNNHIVKIEYDPAKSIAVDMVNTK